MSGITVIKKIKMCLLSFFKGLPFVYMILFILFHNSMCLMKSDMKFQCPPSSGFTDNYTKFYICKRNNENDLPAIYPMQTGNLTANMIRSSPLIVIIGDMNDKTLPLNDPLVKAYLVSSLKNIVYVQHLLTFQKLNCPFSYTQIIAKTINDFILKVYNLNKEVAPNNTHLLGLGMGAVIAAQASFDIPHIKFNRLTGLDPTLYFSSIPSDPYVYPLRPNIAEFTDVYHTNLGLIGRYDIMGDVDVYFNDDVHMPGCNKSNICSHKRAAEYYAETVFHFQGMWGAPCFPGITFHFLLNQNLLCKFCSNMNDLVLVGEYMSYDTRGTFKVLTGSKSPYASGKSLLYY